MTVATLPLRLARRVGAAVQASGSTRLAAGIAHATRRLAQRADPRAAAVARYAAWWAPRRTGPVAVTVAGIRHTVDLADNLQRELYYLGSYERPLRELLLAEASHGAVYVDVGANIGVHALPLARRLTELGGRVIAFEPAPDTADALRRAARANGLTVEVVPIALGRTTGLAPLRRSAAWERDDIGVRSLYGDGDVVGEVQVTSFADWAAGAGLDRLDIVKIDVEGAEHDVLVGMSEPIRRLRPSVIVVEVVDDLLRRSGTSAARLESLLRSLGYRLDGPPLTSAEWSSGSSPIWPNAVFRPS